jgi:argininosuccinate lyase
MWIREAIEKMDHQLSLLQAAFLMQAQQTTDLILPAYTHLQRAQPVLGAHYMLAYCEKFNRDRQRFEEVNKRNNILPLGTGAVAGTSLPIDREMVCQQLGFESVSTNSLDASSDRDFVLDACYALSLTGIHLSGWAEEWILWSTVEFNFIQLPEAFCTCSSMMPQKINPDVLELIRGKASRVVGHLNSLLTLIKGLPLAYNRDLQEDKRPIFDAFDTVFSCLEIAVPLIEQSQWNRESIGKNLEQGYLDATTLMEYLILQGIPQRTAHHAVGTIVRKAMESKTPLRDLPLHEMQSVCDSLDEHVYEILGTENALRAFSSQGSTGPAQVKSQIASWKNRL